MLYTFWLFQSFLSSYFLHSLFFCRSCVFSQSFLFFSSISVSFSPFCSWIFPYFTLFSLFSSLILSVPSYSLHHTVYFFPNIFLIYSIYWATESISVFYTDRLFLYVSCHLYNSLDSYKNVTNQWQRMVRKNHDRKWWKAKKNARAHTREKSTYKANYPEYHI